MGADSDGEKIIGIIYLPDTFLLNPILCALHNNVSTTPMMKWQRDGVKGNNVKRVAESTIARWPAHEYMMSIGRIIMIVTLFPPITLLALKKEIQSKPRSDYIQRKYTD
jgi:hypothetical protein